MSGRDWMGEGAKGATLTPFPNPLSLSEKCPGPWTPAPGTNSEGWEGGLGGKAGSHCNLALPPEAFHFIRRRGQEWRARYLSQAPVSRRAILVSQR